ncbi:sugar ABC transporter ATP-binding protein [Streptomonospora salina]|uniref:Simple sugar transport system ATP-binding protein n=1 Tax=Streptomonospora salina TaxID=104205 RepID=A0A841E7I5_9ACTN|nr:sugar ABC transporter ATP-binding protein [Streptomonospora salina]MBB5997259.1 simple sugar transport system ATP-binding protein [Streptomonospora salina]
MATTAEPAVHMSGIVKEFPGVRALDGAGLRLDPGEVHALLGENGAGKSTLIKILTGVHRPDGGSISVQGAPADIAGPLDAERHGIATVYQEVNLCPNLSVAENILLGREPRGRFGISPRRMNRRAAELARGMELDLDVTRALGDYPIAVQQLVSILRAVDLDARVLVLDEPTSSLDRDEVRILFDLVERLRSRGVAILFVTHFLDQVYELCQRMTVLRNGRLVGEFTTAELSQRDLIGHMLGEQAGELERVEEHAHSGALQPDAAPLLQARGLGRSGGIAPYDLDIAPGRIVGLAGLLGSGRTEAARLLFGADRPDTGSVEVDGRTVPLRTPRAPIAAGLAYCSEDRKAEGLVADLSVADNLLLAMQAARGWMRPLPARTRSDLVERYIAALRIRPSAPDTPAGSLSGGNQQKVLLGRWLIMQPRLLILDEPTRGIDIGAKAEVQRLVAAQAQEGTAVLFISSELEEVLRLSHRVVVLRDRRVVNALDNEEGLDVDRVLAEIAEGGAP